MKKYFIWISTKMYKDILFEDEEVPAQQLFESTAYLPFPTSHPDTEWIVFRECIKYKLPTGKTVEQAETMAEIKKLYFKVFSNNTLVCKAEWYKLCIGSNCVVADDYNFDPYSTKY